MKHICIKLFKLSLLGWALFTISIGMEDTKEQKPPSDPSNSSSQTSPRSTRGEVLNLLKKNAITEPTEQDIDVAYLKSLGLIPVPWAVQLSALAQFKSQNVMEPSEEQILDSWRKSWDIKDYFVSLSLEEPSNNYVRAFYFLKNPPFSKFKPTLMEIQIVDQIISGLNKQTTLEEARKTNDAIETALSKLKLSPVGDVSSSNNVKAHKLKSKGSSVHKRSPRDDKDKLSATLASRGS